MAAGMKLRSGRVLRDYPKKRRFNITRKQRSSWKRKSIARVTIKRTNYNGTWSFNTAATSDFWRYLVFTPNNSFNNFTEFAGVFDEFKVNALKVTFRPSYDSVSPGQIQAYAHYTVDPASTTLPTGVYSQANVNTFLEQSGVKTRTLNRPFSIYFKPRVQDQLFGGGTTTRTVRPTWIKTTENGVDFRGIHMFLQQNNMSQANTNVRLDMYITWYVSFRNLK